MATPTPQPQPQQDQEKYLSTALAILASAKERGDTNMSP